ncbi:hypothetical protein MATL_G00152280 [Megalops atlanticus]|uniref:Uncharacterized protein n=1 Tax=Megalops atlanticus TaxID=7932 RepID=A0A9D3PUN0_MEGAT|nr:hypothetical protein MATL_G00152280 [Megalops atlanticus]
MWAASNFLAFFSFDSDVAEARLSLIGICKQYNMLKVLFLDFAEYPKMAKYTLNCMCNSYIFFIFHFIMRF